MGVAPQRSSAHRRSSPAVLALLAAVSLGATVAGCANPPDPCSLVTLGELRADLGISFQPGAQVGAMMSADRVCMWMVEQGPGSISLSISDWDETVEGVNWEWQRGRPGTRRVTGVGDDALIWSTGTSVTLLVRHGGSELALASTGLNAPGAGWTDGFVDLLRKALDRL